MLALNNALVTPLRPDDGEDTVSPRPSGVGGPPRFLSRAVFALYAPATPAVAILSWDRVHRHGTHHAFTLLR